MKNKTKSYLEIPEEGVPKDKWLRVGVNSYLNLKEQFEKTQKYLDVFIISSEVAWNNVDKLHEENEKLQSKLKQIKEMWAFVDWDDGSARRKIEDILYEETTAQEAQELIRKKFIRKKEYQGDFAKVNILFIAWVDYFHTTEFFDRGLPGVWLMHENAWRVYPEYEKSSKEYASKAFEKIAKKYNVIMNFNDPEKKVACNLSFEELGKILESYSKQNGKRRRN